MTQQELYDLIHLDESYRIERTVSTGDMDKFQEAICAFANDLPGHRKHGYLLIGVDDRGNISGLKVDDALMKRISGIRSDGNILPLPVMSTEKVETPEGDVLVVDVTPSFDTPIRYRGRTFVRIGPRRDIASREEERILAERCAASLPTFDTRPCREATLDDLDLEVIQKEYLPKAIAPEVLEHDDRTLEEQLAALRLYNMQWKCPTYAALIMFGKNPRYFMPGALVQFVRFEGKDNGGKILNERRFEGSLFTILPRLENFIKDGIITKRPVPISILREKDVYNYPYKALRELLMNALMHRDYQANTPTRLYQYDDHIEIMNPGGLYGQARPENFPNVNDYRNSTLAEMMRTLNYVNMFNHGVREVKSQLAENGNPEPLFKVDYITAFAVEIPEARDEETGEKTDDGQELGQVSDQVKQVIHQVVTKYSLSSDQVVPLFEALNTPISASQMRTLCGKKDATHFRRTTLQPMLDDGLLQPTDTKSSHSPQQKYYLTEKGKALYKEIMENWKLK